MGTEIRLNVKDKMKPREKVSDQAVVRRYRTIFIATNLCYGSDYCLVRSCDWFGSPSQAEAELEINYLAANQRLVSRFTFGLAGLQEKQTNQSNQANKRSSQPSPAQHPSMHKSEVQPFASFVGRRVEIVDLLLLIVSGLELSCSPGLLPLLSLHSKSCRVAYSVGHSTPSPGGTGQCYNSRSQQAPDFLVDLRFHIVKHLNLGIVYQQGEYSQRGRSSARYIFAPIICWSCIIILAK